MAFQLSGVIDRSILEVFLDGGERSATITFFPEGDFDTMVIKAGDLNPGVGVSAKVWALQSAWAKYENATGTVVGNSTSSMGMKRDFMGHL